MTKAGKNNVTRMVLEADWLPALGMCRLSWEKRSGALRSRLVSAEEAVSMFGVDPREDDSAIDGMEMDK